ncbi:MAG: DUF1501 domain-containing protein [Planctomycetaceae bacterium]|nr:DUF1501 domain-containing protein [Planctomycetaceae bacterium]
MSVRYACQSSDHGLARRSFLGSVAAAGVGAITGGLGAFTRTAVSDQLQREQKRVVIWDMHGGLSQLESWDPKPGTDTGGPFLSIPTSVPGIHICELLPRTAQQMHHLCLIRGVNTAEDDHGKGRYKVLTGREQSPAANFPEISAVAAKSLTPEDYSLPGHILITPGGGGGRSNDSAYLGPKYASVQLGNGKPPQNTVLPDTITVESDAARQEYRRRLNERFLSRRRTATTDAYGYSYEQALQLMQQRDVFDVSQEPARDHERYGNHDIGRHALLARRLLEHGTPVVKLSHSNYDTHHENFDFHIEQLGELDRAFACFVEDLADRGMLESTLIIMLSEFGRTPRINARYGRDHWSKAWSVMMAGCRVPRGFAYGKTNDNGTEVIDGQCDHANLFHTYLQAVGVDSTASFNIEGRDVPLADPASQPIHAVLA